MAQETLVHEIRRKSDGSVIATQEIDITTEETINISEGGNG